MTKLFIIGEAYGAEEEKERQPFVGASGYALTKMLGEAGIHRADCFLTNVFNIRPPGNKVEAFCGSKQEGIKGFPPLAKSKHVLAQYEPEINRLANELIEHNPNLVLALGNTPLWVLSGKTGITKLRGTTLLSTHTVSGFKVLATYHPAAVLRQWELRPIAVADFVKAAREREFPEIRRPKCRIWIEPTLADLELFYETQLSQSSLVSVDIETAGTQITCIGFGTAETALVIPFHDNRRKSKSYWEHRDDEIRAWTFVRRLLSEKTLKKVFQNGLYDIAFLWRAYGIKVYGAMEDTMLLHHALQPESLKGLGFLGSIYTDFGSWKDMRKHTTTIKEDE